MNQYLDWYDRKAVRMKRLYIRERIVAATGAVLVPVISTLSWPLTVLDHTIDFARVAAAVISLGVALAIALEGVLHHREQWTNYRTTEQYIRAQKWLYETRVGEYAGLSDDEAFRRLVLNIEQAIKNENEVTLNVLARSEGRATSAPQGDGEGPMT